MINIEHANKALHTETKEVERQEVATDNVEANIGIHETKNQEPCTKKTSRSGEKNIVFETGEPTTSYDISDDSDHISSNKLVPYSGLESDSSDGMPKKKMKRLKRFQVEKNNWFSEKNRNRREKGKRYFGRTKEKNGKWSYDVERAPREQKERCHCKVTNKTLKCYEVTEEQRRNIFEYFWGLSWGEKKVYVDSTVKSGFIKRAKDRKDPEQSRRSQTFNYYLKTDNQEIRVCRTMYLNTIGVGRWSIQHWKSKFTCFEKADEEEKTGKRPTKYRNETQNKKKPFEIENESIHEFLDSLPTMESHYCRSSSSKSYVLPEWTSKEELYRFYKKEWCGPKNIRPLSSTTFKKAFDSKNMALFRPKKDECEICNKFKEGYISEEIYNRHILRKKEARKEMEKDIENETFVYTLDLQAVLLSPKSNISILYYKTKLCVHNLCYFNIINKDGFCYLWHEGEGGLNAEEFSSCFYYFVETQVIPLIDENKKVIFWSDGCTYQNRNSVLANVALNLAKQYQITIEHKYLEVGHTQMPVDSMHSTIERRLKSKRINVPAEYAYHCKKARIHPKPYNVKYLDHTFFKSFKNIETVKSIRPGRKPGDPKVTDIRGLKFTPEGEIYYKLRLPDEWILLPQRRKQVSTKTFNELENLHENKIPITARKYSDLQELKWTLPADYHGFYNDLRHE